MNTNELYNEWLEKADYDPDLIKELEEIKGQRERNIGQILQMP